MRMVTSLVHEQYPVTLIARTAPISSLQNLQLQWIEQSSGWIGKLSSLRQVWQRAKESRADIYHFHDPELLLLVPFLKSLGKVIYDVHEDYGRSIVENHQGGALSPILSTVFSLFEKVIARRCDGIVGATSGIAEKFRFHPRSIAIRNFASIDSNQHLKPKQVQKQHDLVYIGGLARERGLFEMLDAVCQLPQVRLTLAGSFIDSEVERAAKGHAGWAHVNFLGHIDSSRVVELLQQSKIGLLPLWPKPRFLESLPLKLFEYMSAGIPVVASDFSSWQPIIQNYRCGMMVEPMSSTAIRDACQYLLEHVEIAEEMGKCGQLAVEQEFNWHAESLRLITFYKEIASIKPI